jgi:hypothetical protein
MVTMTREETGRDGGRKGRREGGRTYHAVGVGHRALFYVQFRQERQVENISSFDEGGMEGGHLRGSYQDGTRDVVQVNSFF